MTWPDAVAFMCLWSPVWLVGLAIFVIALSAAINALRE